MNSHTAGKPLTSELIFSTTDSDSLSEIKNLNLSCHDLNDLQILEKMPNLQIVSLSGNKISSLKDFVRCIGVKELYLRKNNIFDLREIKYLSDIIDLQILWLNDNPCTQIHNYRQIVIKNLPTLLNLDSIKVTEEEKNNTQIIFFSLHPSRNQRQLSYKKTLKNSSQNKQQKLKDQGRKKHERKANILKVVLWLMKQVDRESLLLIKRQVDNIK